jgi:hypothetical protein
LIIHGTEDAALPPAHAHALADEIPDAQLGMIDSWVTSPRQILREYRARGPVTRGA